MKKECVLYERMCNNCGECSICDLDRNKKCDNCEKCLGYHGNYKTMKLKDFITMNGKEEQESK